MSIGPLVPVVLKDAAFRPPDADTYYIVAGNGFFLERRTELYTAKVAVDGGVPGLLPHETQLDLRLPRRLPRALVETALGFFRAVYDRWDGEGILVMFYAPSDGARPVRYRLEAPPQKIQGRVERGRFRADLRLDYGACERPGDEWRKLGTFHSHGPVGPRHSTIDARDELWETGLHLTAGYVNSPLPEFEASFVVNATRFPVGVDDVLERPRAARRHPKRWLDAIEVIELPGDPGYEHGGSYYAY
jgi:hypothetical protein